MNICFELKTKKAKEPVIINEKFSGVKNLRNSTEF
jgi:hypothetical protein